MKNAIWLLGIAVVAVTVICLVKNELEKSQQELEEKLGNV